MAPQAPVVVRRRWPIVVVLALGIAAAIWGLRAALWPCGVLDRTSGCISSVSLDVAGLGLPLAETFVEFPGMDLGPEAGVALVGLKARTDDGWKVVLALFDARTGQPIRALDEVRETSREPWIGEIALSSDGTLAAAVIGSPGAEGHHAALNVYRVADGTLVQTIWEVTSSESDDCVSMLDFSADGQKLQCGFVVHVLATGVTETLLDSEGKEFVYPILATYSGMSAGARDGTSVSPHHLKPGLDLFDSTLRAYFASDSQSLLSLRVARGTNRGQRLYTPPGFRRMAAVTIWDGQTLEIQRAFYANQRYRWAAWSQDATLFGLLTSDLRLDIFTR